MIYFIQHNDKKLTNLNTKKLCLVNVFSQIKLYSEIVKAPTEENKTRKECSLT